jgi:hypothetical protein
MFLKKNQTVAHRNEKLKASHHKWWLAIAALPRDEKYRLLKSASLLAESLDPFLDPLLQRVCLRQQNTQQWKMLLYGRSMPISANSIEVDD